MCNVLKACAIAFIVSATGLMIRPAFAQTTDVHQLFETRCGRCHGHAGAFARNHLQRSGDRLTSRKTGEDIAIFLTRHYGNLSKDEIEALIRTFLLQLSRGGLYEKKCRLCHDRAYDFARNRLIITPGGLRGRYSKRDIEAFLAKHGRLTKKEIHLIISMLRWQLAGGAPPDKK